MGEGAALGFDQAAGGVHHDGWRGGAATGAAGPTEAATGAEAAPAFGASAAREAGASGTLSRCTTVDSLRGIGAGCGGGGAAATSAPSSTMCADASNTSAHWPQRTQPPEMRS